MTNNSERSERTTASAASGQPTTVSAANGPQGTQCPDHEMFDLEKAIASWRRSFAYRRAFFEDDLEELERHVRDHVARRVGYGLSEKEAFGEAVRAVGDYGAMEAEYQKVFWSKLKHRRRLLREMTWRVTMLRNYLKVALRHLQKHKGYAFINIGGLVIGITSCLLILLYVQYELSYDSHFEAAERIHRVVTTDNVEGQVERNAMVTSHLAPALSDDYPWLEVTRLHYWVYNDILVRYADRSFSEGRFFRADSTFLDVFSLPMRRGNPGTALREPNTIIITEAMAEKYFGDRDPIGELLIVNESREYKVTGVIENIPPNSHFKFDFLAFSGTGFPGGWSEKEVWTYVRLPESYEAADLERQFPMIINKYFPEHVHDNISLSLQPITTIHLDSHLDEEIESNGNRTYVYIFSVVAFILLLLACINYMNLATARATRRATEIGLRKVVGATRKQLIGQLMSASVLTSLLAMVLSIALALWVKPLLQTFVGIAFPPLDLSKGAFWLDVIGIGLFVGFLSGSYPAFFLSSFRPAQILKGGVLQRAQGVTIRQGLVVFQFAATITLLIGAGIVYAQMRYVQDESLGMEREHILVVNVPRSVAVSWDWEVEVFRNELMQVPDILAVGDITIPWDRGLEQHRMRLARGAGGAAEVAVTLFWVSEDQYLDLYGLELVEGRGTVRRFDPDSTAGLQYEFVLNETAARQLNLETPVGTDLELMFGQDEWSQGQVVGLVKDFHFQTLHHTIRPLAFLFGRGFSNVAIRMAPNNVASTVDRIAATWQRLAPDWPFNYVFLDEDYKQQYRAEQQVAKLLNLFTLLAILIACLGLFGLAAFTAEQRTKEIGVRKVLGASVGGLVVLLSRDFLLLVGMAFLLASPVAYLATQRWLEGFAYRVDVSWMIFLLAGSLALAIALLTVSYQAIKAALADPVEALRYE